MKDLKGVLSKKKFKRKGGAYNWQDHAVRVAKKLGVKPNASWFKFFKRAYRSGKKNLLETVYRKIADLRIDDPEKYFYKVFHNLNDT